MAITAAGGKSDCHSKSIHAAGCSKEIREMEVRRDV